MFNLIIKVEEFTLLQTTRSRSGSGLYVMWYRAAKKIVYFLKNFQDYLSVTLIMILFKIKVFVELSVLSKKKNRGLNYGLY